MDPTAVGRMRGFRAPEADPSSPDPTAPAQPAAAAPPQSAGEAEILVAGPPPSPRRRLLPSRTGRPIGDKSNDGGSRWRWAFAAGAVLVVAMVIIAALAFRLGAAGSAAGEASASPTRTPAATATPLAVTDLYQQVAPSVVLITTSKGALGSGVIVTDTGTVLTANHVISDGGSLTIQFADGTKSDATVASADPKTDTATLTPKKLPEVVVAATLGGNVAVGADVVAIGNPLGLRDSTTTGVVSGLSRTTKTNSRTLSGLIQFDAAVNPGSSGGPLLDSQGLVIGVVVSIADPGKDDSFAGIGFAVPIGTALGGGSGDGPGGSPPL